MNANNRQSFRSIRSGSTELAEVCLWPQGTDKALLLPASSSEVDKQTPLLTANFQRVENLSLFSEEKNPRNLWIF